MCSPFVLWKLGYTMWTPPSEMMNGCQLSHELPSVSCPHQGPIPFLEQPASSYWSTWGYKGLGPWTQLGRAIGLIETFVGVALKLTFSLCLTCFLVVTSTMRTLRVLLNNYRGRWSQPQYLLHREPDSASLFKKHVWWLILVKGNCFLLLVITNRTHNDHNFVFVPSQFHFLGSIWSSHTLISISALEK